jgi:hypothetical protein
MAFTLPPNTPLPFDNLHMHRIFALGIVFKRPTKKREGMKKAFPGEGLKIYFYTMSIVFNPKDLYILFSSRTHK